MKQKDNSSSIAVLKCPKCSKIYELGVNSFLISDDDVAEFVTKAGATLLSTRKTPAPDLVQFQKVNFEIQGKTAANISKIKKDLLSGIRRNWICDDCREANEYPFDKVE